MKIAPIDIAHKEFDRKFMGFDPVAVTEFLTNISSEMEELIRERNSLKETLREKELSILEYKERDHALTKTLETATQMSERIRSDAEREARLIVNDANYKAETITRDARDSIKRIYQEITDLKKIRVQFESNLRALAQAHLAMIEEGAKYMPTTKAGSKPELQKNPDAASSCPPNS